MPLALQALLAPLVLLAAAAMVRMRPRNPANGWIAFGATAVAAGIALVELLRLAPGEHVDVPYLTTFPYADLAIRMDGLSLAFAAVTLTTAALLMLARQRVRGDRREPWLGWLLTSAAAGAVIMADNLLLVYVALQVLTLAWSGALDEAAPRRRGLRISLQIADIGLLLAAVALAALALWRRTGARLPPLLLGSQACIALALSIGGDPLFTVAGTWLWLTLIPLTGLLSLRVARESAAHALSLLQLAMIPGSVAFVGIWLGGLALDARGLGIGIVPLALAVGFALVAILFDTTVARSIRMDVATAWAGALLLIAAVPIIAMNPLVLPAAGTVRAVQGGTVAASLLLIRTAAGAWPALPVSIGLAVVLGAALWRFGGRWPLRPRPRAGRRVQLRLKLPGQLRALPGWSRLLLWGGFLVVVGMAAVRP